MKLTPALGALFLFAAPALAQNGGPPVAFAQVTEVPIPLESASGRFSSLNPLNQTACALRRVSGRVVSQRLVMVRDVDCGRPGHDNVLVNVELANPADAAQMVVGRNVTVTGAFKSAEEDRDPAFVAQFLIADKASVAPENTRDRAAPPVAAFTSYMLCQPPALDALATQLGSDLCVQSTLLPNLAAVSPALEAAARAPAKVSPADPMPGAPGAITCRTDPGISDRHLPAIACARNSYWAWYTAKWRDPLSSQMAPP